MKKFFYFLFFVLLAGSLYGQDEVLLKTLGRAPLAAYLSSEDELRSVLKKHNEEIGRALDFFPGGALGEEVYIELYKSVDEMPIWEEKIPIGQRICWMIYKNGGLLKNVRWMGNDPIDAFVFEIKAGGKEFKFATPLRCGNISLVSMREIPVEKVQTEESQPKPQKPKVQKKPQEEIISPSQPQPVIKPELVKKNPNWKVKIGAGWNQMNASSLEHEEKTDFSSLIPKEDDFFYCEDGLAAWLYTPGGKGSPFSNGQKINLRKQIYDFESKQSGIPIFISVERQLIDNFYVGINFFHMGKFNIQYKEANESIFVNEMRFLGNYEIDNVDVYYVGFNRQRNELMVNEELSINEIAGEAKYEISVFKDFSILPLAGLTWQIQKGEIKKTELVTQLYPFREEVISTENIDIPLERIKENYFHPYLGMEIEFSYFFLRGKYCFGDFSKQYNSPWEIQGGVSISF
jgi:hypothetical protein